MNPNYPAPFFFLVEVMGPWDDEVRYQKKMSAKVRPQHCLDCLALSLTELSSIFSVLSVLIFTIDHVAKNGSQISHGFLLECCWMKLSGLRCLV